MKKFTYCSFAMILLCSFLTKGCGKKEERDKETKVICRYLGYACGDCYPQYGVRKIITYAGIGTSQIIGRDIRVIFANKEDEAKLDSAVGKCAICYDYYFRGTISKNSEDTFYTMKVKNYSIELRDSLCCD